MAQVAVTINGRAYPVACNDGEEQRITELARYVDGKVRTFARDLGQIGEARLLLLAALVLADELADAQSGTLANGPVDLTGELAVQVETLAQRIETIASRLETHHI
ncbi:MAG TPA: cell division protein ZapA [Stellaceae bacterium]|nr:cell division protein ZapA [Stellaceae bacterium]